MVLEGPAGQIATSAEPTHCDCCRKPASEFSPIPEYDEGTFSHNTMVCSTCFTEISRITNQALAEATERDYRLWLEYR